MALKETYGNQVQFVIVDVRQQDGSLLAQEYGIRSIPHLIMLDGTGKVVFNEVGGKSEDYLKGKIEELLLPGEAAVQNSSNPYELAVQRALAEGKPVFLEFYSDT